MSKRQASREESAEMRASRKLVIESIKKRKYSPLYEEIVSLLLNMANKERKEYNTLANKQKYSDVVLKKIKEDFNLLNEFIENVYKFTAHAPNESMSDIAAFIVSILEEYRHEKFSEILIVDLSERYNMNLVAREFKLSEKFPTTSNLTPDLLFEKNKFQESSTSNWADMVLEEENQNVEKDYHVIEVKCRSFKVENMEPFYHRYKKEIGDNAKVTVVNLNPKELFIIEHGDFKYYENEIPNVDDIKELNDLIFKIRSMYSKFRLFLHYDGDENPVNFDYVENFTWEDVESLESYEEVKNLHTVEQWDKIKEFLSFNYHEKDKETIETTLINSKEDLKKHLKRPEEMEKFLSVLEKQIETSNYSPTNLQVLDFVERMDKKNSEMYKPIEGKYKPSIYMGISTTNTKVIESRTDYYKSVFQNIKQCHSDNNYCRAVIEMLNDCFNSDEAEMLLNSRNFDYKAFRNVTESYVQMRESDPDQSASIKKSNLQIMKKEKITQNGLSFNIYMNSVFSWSSGMHHRHAITGFGGNSSGDPDAKKDVIIVNESLDDLEVVKNLSSRMFKYDIRSGPLKSLFLEQTANSEDVLVEKIIPKQLNNKFSEHLLVMHRAFKNMLSMCMISNTKFRLIQTDDPNNFFIMLPNANVRDNHPIRYFNITIAKIEDLNMTFDEYRKLMKILGISQECLNLGEHAVMISKVISLDITRMKILSNSFAEYFMLRSYYETIKVTGGDEADKDSLFCFLSSQMATISSLTITENFKNIMMVAYSDFSNIDKLIEDKFNCRPNTITHVYLVKLMEKGILKSQEQINKIKESREETYYDPNVKEFKSIGFKDITLEMPLTGYKVRTPKEIFHEAYLLFYIGKKGLHGSPQENIKLYEIGRGFEEEYETFLKNYETPVQESSKNEEFGYSFDLMFKSSLYTYSDLMHKSAMFRSNLEKNLKLKQSPFVHQQFSSTKSCLLYNINSQIKFHDSDLDEDPDMRVDTFGSWLKTSKIEDPYSFCVKNNAIINRINEVKKANSKVKTFKNLMDDVNYNRTLPELIPVVKGDLKYVHAKGTSYFGSNIKDYKSPKSSKVMEEFYKHCERNGIKTTDSLLCSLKSIKDNPRIRVFPKNQRTSEDREIYTGDITCRLCLFPIEMTFKSINQCIDEECITTPGDTKHRKMHDQRMDMIRERKYDKIEVAHGGPLFSMSSDASKWSARDCVTKFIISIVTNPFLIESEKIHLMYCLIKYYKKDIILTDSCLLNAYKLYNPNNKDDIYRGLTNNFTSNNFLVRSNWLQGNLNNLSSFVHVTMAKTIHCFLENWNEMYQDSIRYKYLVHSDDSVHDFSMMMNPNIHERPFGTYFRNKSNHGQLMIAIVKYISKKHSITVNEKKTYISENFKEFLSTLLVGNEIFYFYMSDLLPITSDTSYSSPLDDFAAYSGYINNSFTHLAPLGIIKVCTKIIDYLCMSTYNLDVLGNKHPLKSMSEINGVPTIDLPISICPRYKIPLEYGGLLPYYTGDALKISDFIIQILKYNKRYDNNKTIEDNLTIENIESVLNVTNRSWINYMKSCVMTQKVSIYHDDNEDPYGQKMNDLCQSSVISLKPTNRGRVPSYESYRCYKQNVDEYEMKFSFNPQWILKKPTEYEDSKVNLLSSYSMNSYINSLSFSTAELDFARRIMDSNKHIYRLNLDGLDQNKDMQIREIYQKIMERIHETQLTAESIASYLGVYLFSNKVHAAIHQAFHTKKIFSSSVQSTKPKFMIHPRSLFSRPDYGNSTDILCNILIDQHDNKVNETFYTSSLIDYIYSVFKPISKYLKKNYDDIIDIDPNFEEYIKARYGSENYQDYFPKIHGSDRFSFQLVEIKKIYLSMIINNFTYDRRFKISSQKKMTFDANGFEKINIKGIMLNIDAFMRRSDITSKTILSTKRNNNIQEFWLDRFGFYTTEYIYIKYRSDEDIVIENERVRSRSNLQSNYISACIMSSCLKDNADFFDETKKFPNIFGINFDEYLSSARDSDSLFDNATYHRYQDAGKADDYFLRKLKDQAKVCNYWRVPESDDRTFSVIYHYKNLFISFKGLLKNRQRILKVNAYTIGWAENDSYRRILNKFNEDMKLNTRQFIVEYKRQMLERAMGRRQLYQTRSGEVRLENYQNERPIAHIDELDISDVSLNTEEVDRNGVLSTMVQFLSSIDKSKIFEFEYRVGRTNSRGLVMSYLESRIHKDKSNSPLVIFMNNEGMLQRNPERAANLTFRVEPQFIRYLYQGNKVVPSIDMYSKVFRANSRKFVEESDNPEVAFLLQSYSEAYYTEREEITLYHFIPNIRAKPFTGFDDIVRSCIIRKFPYDEVTSYVSKLGLTYENSVALLIILIIKIDTTTLLIDLDEEELFRDALQ
nr:MAG: RNA-dependent RNA polymerase [Artemisia fimovirus 1]